MLRAKQQSTILDAKATTGIGTSIRVDNFKDLILEVSSESSANLTVKIQGSRSETAPDFSAAASTANPWTYVASYDLENPSSIIPGSTGIIFLGTDAVYNLAVNTDGFVWLNAVVTARSAGKVTAKLLALQGPPVVV